MNCAYWASDSSYNQPGMIADCIRILHPNAIEIRMLFAMKAQRIKLGRSFAGRGSDSFLRVVENVSFPSPSTAAIMVLGRPANGWIEWKYEDGKSLDEVKR